jgi:K+-sensing histidine kinase KdpD
MGGTTRTVLLHCGGAVVFTPLAVLVRSLLDPVVGDYLPLATPNWAVALASRLGGYGPALLAVVLGYLACDYLFIAPRGKVLVLDTRNLIGLILYLFSCAIIIGFGAALRMARRRTDRHRDSLRIMPTAMTTGCRHV